MSMGSRWAVSIGVLTALLAAYPIWNEWNKSPSLALTIQSSSPLVASLPEAEAIEVVASGKVISDPHLVLMTLENDGGVAIRTADFEGPIEIQVSRARVVRATEIPTKDRTVRTNISSGPSFISIAPALFNPGDKLQIALIASGGKPQIEANARISNIKRIDVLAATPARPQKRSPFFGALDILAGLVLSVAAGYIYRHTFRSKLDFIRIHQFSAIVLSWGAFMGGMSALTSGLTTFSFGLSGLAVPILVIAIALSWFVTRKREGSPPPTAAEENANA